jgi:hypothetical protein
VTEAEKYAESDPAENAPLLSRDIITDVENQSDVDKYLQVGKLKEMVRIDRMRGILNDATEYSQNGGGVCTMVCRTLSRRRSVLTQHENELEYLNERLSKLLDESVTDQNWFDLTETWVMLLSLRSKISSECGHAIIDTMMQDDALLQGIGRVHQFSEANLDEIGEKDMIMAMRKGPGQHLKSHAYEYRRKVDTELAQIKRLKEWQSRAFALFGTALVAVLIGAANLLARVLYAKYFVEESAGGY